MTVTAAQAAAAAEVSDKNAAEKAHLDIRFHPQHLFFNRKKDRKTREEVSRRSDEMAITCIRALVMDSVHAANSGHPGTAMSMAPVAYTLFSRVLMYDPLDPQWPNRDRFVLSMGHASTLLYATLHLAGVREVGADGKVIEDRLAVPLDAMQKFRQLGSTCPGHPEYGLTTGVEMTTGPLGQGVASSVGMAIASKHLQTNYNDLFSYDVYALAGDGCLQEGVASEAASLAGHLKLDNLCWIWDNNHITIEGNTAWAISEDIATRFMAYNWNVVRVGDANDVESLTRAFLSFKREKDRPSLIIVDSHIAFGSPTKQDSFTAHGTPMNAAEVTETKQVYGWPDEKWLVPEDVAQSFREQMAERGGVQAKAWRQKLTEYELMQPDKHASLTHMLNGTLPADWKKNCKDFLPNAKGLATRQSSGECLNMVASAVPWMLGGSADLATSCLTTLKFPGTTDFMPPMSGWGDYSGRNFHFGIREHAMGSIMNGMALCNLRPFGSTFLVFSDYMKPPIRMSALMEIPCIWIFTHDSIGVGEDGPTHQPIEQLACLRCTPGLLTFRPCDANEVLETWKYITPLVDDPVALVLSRQAVPTLDRSKYAPASGVAKGAYVLYGAEHAMPDLILMATGTEVKLMLDAHDVLAAEGVKVRSVSMTCMELFRRQSDEYIKSVLPKKCRARVSIEAASRDPWGNWIGLDGEHIGMITFGASGTIQQVQKHLGFTVEAIVAASRRVMSGNARSIESEMSVMKAWKRQKI